MCTHTLLHFKDTLVGINKVVDFVSQLYCQRLQTAWLAAVHNYCF